MKHLLYILKNPYYFGQFWQLLKLNKTAQNEGHLRVIIGFEVLGILEQFSNG